MKIAISTSVIQRGKTGVAQYVFSLVRALMAHADEHEFHLLVLEEDLPLFAFAASKMKLVTVSERWRPAVRNILWHQTLLPRWLKNQGIDVLHVPSYRRLPWFKPCATVATIHDLAPFHVRGKYDLARMLYGRFVVKALARRQDAVIAVSTSTRQDIQRFFDVAAEKQSTCLNGLDHGRFNPGDPLAAKDFVTQRWQLHAPYFLYVSRLEHPAKNHVRLIEAFNRFKAATGSPWQLALGGSDWHGAEVIHAAAKASPYAADIRFLGFVDDAALPDLYRAAGAFVYPSMFEGFGMPPIEAMACGCPVISSTAGSLAEVIADAALTVDPASIPSIESALTALAVNSSQRQHLVQKGLENARRFNWDHNAGQVMQTYRKAASEHDATCLPRQFAA
jgi:glycosyltransferase involved in cell wall biosynthesis